MAAWMPMILASSPYEPYAPKDQKSALWYRELKVDVPVLTIRISA